LDWLSKNKRKHFNGILPDDFDAGKFTDFLGLSHSYLIEEDLYSKIQNFTKKNRTSVFNFVLSCLNLAVNKVFNKDEIFWGIPFIGRSSLEQQKVLGPFVYRLVLKISTQESLTAKDFLGETSHNYLSLLKNESRSMMNIFIESMRKDDTSKYKVVDVALSFLNSKNGIPPDYSLKLKSFEGNFDMDAETNIIFYCYELENSIKIVTKYRKNFFKDIQIDDILNSTYKIMNKIIANSDITIHKILNS
jgi:hypothetical protein